MDSERLNLKAQEGIGAGVTLAVKLGHRNVSPAHVIHGLLEIDHPPTRKLFTQGGIDVEKLKLQARAAIDSLPRAEAGATDTPIERALEAILIRAEESANALGEKYIGVNHIL